MPRRGHGQGLRRAASRFRTGFVFVPAELHIYRSGPHGVGLAPDDPALSAWPDRLEDWLRVQGAPGE